MRKLLGIMVVLLLASGVVVPAGAVESQMGVAHSAAGYSGAYDVYVGRGVSERPGVLFYFDADSSSGRFRYLDSRLMGRVRDAAAQRDLVFVAVHTPGGKGKYGLWNWWDDRAKGAYGRDLVKTVVQRYGLDASRVWVSGWSGGAEVITKEILAQDTGWIGGGGMIVMGGGEAEFGVQSPGGGAAGMKLRWFVGDRDGYGATIPKDWSARVAAERGVASYRAAGFRDTRLVVLPNQNHFYDVAAVIKKGLTEPSQRPHPQLGDVVSTDSDGKMWNYQGSAGSRFGNRHQVGWGWQAFEYHEQTDWNQDGVMDIFGKDDAGHLYVYLGSAHGGYGSRTLIGWGFKDYRVFTGTTCRGCRPSVFGIDRQGQMFRWTNNGGYLSQRTLIGWGWHFNHVIPVDWDGDGQTDIAAVDNEGTMWMYRTQRGKFSGTRQVIGWGWHFQSITPVRAFQGRNVILAKENDGKLMSYPYTQGRFTYHKNRTVGVGWSSHNIAGECANNP